MIISSWLKIRLVITPNSQLPNRFRTISPSTGWLTTSGSRGGRSSLSPNISLGNPSRSRPLAPTFLIQLRCSKLKVISNSLNYTLCYDFTTFDLDNSGQNNHERGTSPMDSFREIQKVELTPRESDIDISSSRVTSKKNVANNWRIKITKKSDSQLSNPASKYTPIVQGRQSVFNNQNMPSINRIEQKEYTHSPYAESLITGINMYPKLDHEDIHFQSFKQESKQQTVNHDDSSKSINHSKFINPKSDINKPISKLYLIP